MSRSQANSRAPPFKLPAAFDRYYLTPVDGVQVVWVDRIRDPALPMLAFWVRRDSTTMFACNLAILRHADNVVEKLQQNSMMVLLMASCYHATCALACLVKEAHLNADQFSPEKWMQSQQSDVSRFLQRVEGVESEAKRHQACGRSGHYSWIHHQDKDAMRLKGKGPISCVTHTTAANLFLFPVSRVGMQQLDSLTQRRQDGASASHKCTC